MFISVAMEMEKLYSEVKANQLSQKASVRSLKQDSYSKSPTSVCQHLDSSLRWEGSNDLANNSSPWWVWFYTA